MTTIKIQQIYCVSSVVKWDLSDLQSWLKIFYVYRKEKIVTLEKPRRHHFSQVIKVDITCDKTYQYHIPQKSFNEGTSSP